MSDPATTNHSRLLIIDDHRAIHDDFRKIPIPENLRAVGRIRSESLWRGTNR